MLDDEDDYKIFCTERLIPRKIKPQNIIFRLRNRENAFKNGSNFNLVREFYQNIHPNLTIVNVEKPPCYLRKFSPDGKYLIAFSSDQASLEIYEFQGSSAANDLIQQHVKEDIDLITNSNTGYSYEIRSRIFEKLFKLKHTVNMVNNEKQLNRECSLFTNDSRYVIIGAAIFIPEDMRPHFYDLYTNNESITPTAR